MAEKRDWRGKIQVDFETVINRESVRLNTLRDATDEAVNALSDYAKEDPTGAKQAGFTEQAFELTEKLRDLELSLFMLRIAREEQVGRWRNESLQWSAIVIAVLSALIAISK